MRLLAIGALVFLSTSTGATADAPSAKPLPANKPCPYPPEAQKEYVAGPVRFVVHVRPDGTVESVDVPRVPRPSLGFVETIQACLSEWRFEPAPPGETALRRHEGRLRFRLDAKEEPAIRNLLESLATSWNAGDMKAVEDFASRPDDSPTVRPQTDRSIRQQLQGDRPVEPWRMELEPDVEYIRFLEPELVGVRQPYRRSAATQSQPAAPEGETALDALLAKGSRGWRILRISPVKTGWLEGVRIGGQMREPRKVKDARPRYPDNAKESGVMGAVILECLISPEGKVTSLRVLVGHPLLRDAAVAAVRKWEYTPTLFNGVPVPVIMMVTVNFRLSRGSSTNDDFGADR